MLFNSLAFFIFLPIVFLLYWLVFDKSVRMQNWFVVVASYVFYGWWDWRFLLLMGLTSLVAWTTGLLMTKGRGKLWLTTSLVINLGILAVFKYLGFFIDSAAAFLGMLGFRAHLPTLQILLPVGISFYTFQALSYTVDVYRGNLKPVKDLGAFFAFISFFPQLVAGPIERATNLLPQFLAPRRFDYAEAVEGCRFIFWGFIKKLLIADNCAVACNALLANAAPSSVSLWAGMICFAFQIYGDFSGYSDIARGCGRLFGIRLMRNFAHPYFARDIAEFWRRWHISLTTWFRDYLYIPLGGSRCGTAKKVRNTFAIFLVSGFWHGANWTFIAWGLFHAVCFLPLLLLGKNRTFTNTVAEDKSLPTFKELVQMTTTFLLAVIGWTFFRAPDISTAFAWLHKMVIPIDLRIREVYLGGAFLTAIQLLSVFLVVEWFNRSQDLPRLPSSLAFRWIVYLTALLILAIHFAPGEAFIYFQF